MFSLHDFNPPPPLIIGGGGLHLVDFPGGPNFPGCVLRGGGGAIQFSSAYILYLHVTLVSLWE